MFFISIDFHFILFINSWRFCISMFCFFLQLLPSSRTIIHIVQVRVYRTIPLHFPKGEKEDKGGKKWRGDLNYSVRTKSDINIDALPTKEGPYYGVVLYRPWDDRFSNMKTGALYFHFSVQFCDRTLSEDQVGEDRQNW